GADLPRLRDGQPPGARSGHVPGHMRLTERVTLERDGGLVAVERTALADLLGWLALQLDHEVARVAVLVIRVLGVGVSGAVPAPGRAGDGRQPGGSLLPALPI